MAGGGGTATPAMTPLMSSGGGTVYTGPGSAYQQAMLGLRHRGSDYLKGRKSHTFRLDEYRSLHRDLLKSSAREREQMPGLIRMRRDLIVMASICTDTVLELSGVGSMMVSRYALKEGMLASLSRK